MKIERELRLVHCSDGRIKKEYQLSEPVTGEFAAFCGQFGSVRVIEGLKAPYFTFLISDCLNIKGFIGGRSIEVWFSPEYVGPGEEFILLLAEDSASGIPGPGLRERHRQLTDRGAGTPARQT